MNQLLKTSLVCTLILVLFSCNRMVKEEPYLSAQSNPTLNPVAETDLPRTTNSLDIPEVKASGDSVAPDSRPPEMAFARRRSDDENVVIIESGGMPTMEIFNQLDVQALIFDDHGDNWQLLDQDQENCQATFRFYDPISEQLGEQGFFKKLFTNKNTYQDRSGEYILTCLQLPQKQQIWLQTVDFKAPSSYVVDDLFNKLFEAATAKTETDQ